MYGVYTTKKLPHELNSGSYRSHLVHALREAQVENFINFLKKKVYPKNVHNVNTGSIEICNFYLKHFTVRRIFNDWVLLCSKNIRTVVASNVMGSAIELSHGIFEVLGPNNAFEYN
jgi:uncharacterized Rmd1/YagE family protein